MVESCETSREICLTSETILKITKAEIVESCETSHEIGLLGPRQELTEPSSYFWVTRWLRRPKIGLRSSPSKPSNSSIKLFTTGSMFPPDPRGPLPRGPKSASGAPRPNQAILLLNFLLQASLFLRIQEDPFREAQNLPPEPPVQTKQFYY